LGKLRIFSGSQICKILQSYGFVVVRQKRSHVIMQKFENETTITVPVPQHNPIKTGTLLSIIRQSQLPRTLFEI
jgi:predicted RNA binding protein YcfA (HicA-like mRNA interferase family)